MIDTVKFKVKVTNEILQLIKKKSLETTRINNETGSTELKYYNSHQKIGSYDSNINIFFDDFNSESVSFELSIPKFLFGENVHLVDVTNISAIFDKLYMSFVNIYGQFPHWKKWEIKRLDICYAWKFESDEIAKSILSNLRNYKLPRHKVSHYEDSIYSYSQNITSKWYLKKPEFIKHDYYKHFKRNISFAAYIRDFSTGVIRFEIELKRNGLKRAFKKKVILTSDINIDTITSILKRFFSIYMKNPDVKLMSEQEVVNQLFSTFKPQKATRLYSYWKLFYDESLVSQNTLRTIGRFTKWRNIRDLNIAKVGIPVSKNFISDLTIPSNIAPVLVLTSTDQFNYEMYEEYVTLVHTLQHCNMEGGDIFNVSHNNG